MLVVISMIAALAGISLPVYKSIQKKVEKQKLEMLLGSIERAVDNFETEYNYLPYAGAAYPTGDSVYYFNGTIAPFVGVLMGLENSINFKKIAFLEIQEAKGSSSGGSSWGPYGYKDGVVNNGDGTADLYSPWGMKYAVRLDHDMDGEVNRPLVPSSSGMKLYGYKIAIYTPGSSNSADPKDTWITNFPYEAAP